MHFRQVSKPKNSPLWAEMLFQALLKDTTQRFREAGLETPDLDARFLLQDLLGISNSERLSGPIEINDEQQIIAETAITRRLAGEPISRILGYREFWGRKFFLSPSTLDPRPDTETLIEAVLESSWKAPRILDLGTGTGCILLTLLHEIRDSSGVGIDLSAEACKTAQKNAEAHGLSSRSTIQNADWVDSLEGKYDLIVSNPPYIPSEIIPTLSVEVQNHDPILALDGGEDGLNPYKFLLSALKKFLVPGGFIFFEIGQGQLPDIERLVKNSDATLIQFWTDLGGVPRVVKISYGDK